MEDGLQQRGLTAPVIIIYIMFICIYIAMFLVGNIIHPKIYAEKEALTRTAGTYK